MYDKRTFQHDGKEYEIRVASDGHTIHVRAFLNGKPANGYTYSVEVLTQVDAKMSDALVNPIEELIKTATSDVKNGIWEKYVAAVSAAGNQSA
jgi:hypothetical protein